MMSKMEFDCKLAHCIETKKISGFNSIKELYERISTAFSVPINDILFCTLNTHNFMDMESLLGNYLSLGDLIVVHMCGKSKDLNIKKNQEYLGLTITDNGAGKAFIKKISSNGDLSREDINPGDHIAAINLQSTVGLRHYEVAKAIREVPQNTNFTMHIIKPLQSNDLSIINTTVNKSINNNKPIHLISTPETISDSLFESLTNSSLPIDRLLSKGSTDNNQLSSTTTTTTATTNGNVNDKYRIIIEKINSILESFLGINDNTLAIQLYRLAKENKKSFEDFVTAIKLSELSYFNFGENIQTYLWECVNLEKLSTEKELEIKDSQFDGIKL